MFLGYTKKVKGVSQVCTPKNPLSYFLLYSLTWQIKWGVLTMRSYCETTYDNFLSISLTINSCPALTGLLGSCIDIHGLGNWSVGRGTLACGVCNVNTGAELTTLRMQWGVFPDSNIFLSYFFAKKKIFKNCQLLGNLL